MVLNLRGLSAEFVKPKTFVTHGHVFSSAEYRSHEFGYMDAIRGETPTMKNVHYRQGYLAGIVDNN